MTTSKTVPFVVTQPNTSCGFSAVLQTGDCVTVSNVGVTSSGPDPLNALLGTSGGHALWFVYTLPALGPNGADVTWTITPGSPAIGAVNAGIVSGPCSSGKIQQQTSAGLETTLAQSLGPFTGRSSGRTTTTQAIGVAAPASFGSYVQNRTLPVTLVAHVNSGETVHLEVDNYGASAQGSFTVCVGIGFPSNVQPVLTFDNYFRPEQ